MFGIVSVTTDLDMFQVEIGCPECGKIVPLFHEGDNHLEARKEMFSVLENRPLAFVCPECDLWMMTELIDVGGSFAAYPILLVSVECQTDFGQEFPKLAEVFRQVKINRTLEFNRMNQG